MASNSGTGQLIHAEIKNLSTNAVVRCMFNPEEYTMSKSNKWNERATQLRNIPEIDFQSGDPITLNLNLHFDTTEAHAWFGNKAGEDVRTYTTGLWQMMLVQQKKGQSGTDNTAPPHCRFSWGTNWSFEAVITSLTETFTLFKPDGTPLRSKVVINLKQIVDASSLPKQNPTSGGSPGERLRTIYQGETLPGIAFEEYGDSGKWRYLAEINDLDDPRCLRPGQTLYIKPLPTSDL
jgi:hypothetical protein